MGWVFSSKARDELGRPQVKTTAKTVGFVTCLIAILAMTGSHWLVLQSVAWARMLVEFSSRESLPNALAKTFDGRHPCPLCKQVSQGQQEERERNNQVPWEKPTQLPEFFCDSGRVTVPLAPMSPSVAPVGMLHFFYDFVESPPKPPPRAS